MLRQNQFLFIPFEGFNTNRIYMIIFCFIQLSIKKNQIKGVILFFCNDKKYIYVYIMFDKIELIVFFFPLDIFVRTLVN